MEENEMIAIPKWKYDRLLKIETLVTCFQNAGVDNWDGYSFAAQAYFKATGDDELPF